MKQRLGLAIALIGRRELLVLDEPTNGLDPAGMTEIRSLIRDLPVRHGVTVFLSSHLLTEVEQIATHVGILSRGELVFQGTVAELSGRRHRHLRIRTPDAAAAAALLTGRGFSVRIDAGSLIGAEVAAAAAMNRALIEGGHDVHHLSAETGSLEDVFLSMTDAEVQ
jgi:lantibiotic transport system ATP-binding protein